MVSLNIVRFGQTVFSLPDFSALLPIRPSCATLPPMPRQKVDGFSFGFDAELNVRFDLSAV